MEEACGGKEDTIGDRRRFSDSIMGVKRSIILVSRLGGRQAWIFSERRRREDEGTDDGGKTISSGRYFFRIGRFSKIFSWA